MNTVKSIRDARDRELNRFPVRASMFTITTPRGENDALATARGTTPEGATLKVVAATPSDIEGATDYLIYCKARPSTGGSRIPDMSTLGKGPEDL